MRRVALIMGGASGIGAASATALAEAGEQIILADLDVDLARKTLASLPGDGHIALAVDAAHEAQVAKLFADIEAEAGPVALLVVAAGMPGYIDGQRPTLRTTPVSNWDAVMGLNLRGPFLAIREMLLQLERAPVPDARIILIGSLAAQMLSRNSPPAYVASKGGIMSLARVAAAEAAMFGATVNIVAPGAIDTPMLRSVMTKDQDATYFGATVAGRPGSAEEVAAAVAFLATPAASYINGACIDVNGGLLMR